MTLDWLLLYGENVFPLPNDENICDNVPQWLLNVKQTFPRFTPCQFYDSMVCFAITAPLLAMSWVFAFYLFNFISKSFREINPSHKKVILRENVFNFIFLWLLCLLCFKTSKLAIFI
jgi:hypothetical protein